MIRHCSLLVALCGLGFSTSGLAEELMIFPNDGQSAEQQEQDKFACYNWAKGESGFDPMAPPTATEPPPQQGAQKGGAGKGLVRGAAVGGIVGDSSKSARRGAAAGATVGGMQWRWSENDETRTISRPDSAETMARRDAYHPRDLPVR